MGSVEEAQEIIALLEMRLSLQIENAPRNRDVMTEEQYRPEGGANRASASSVPQEETRTDIKQTTSTISMSISVIDHRPQEQSNMATLSAPIMARATM